MWAKEWMIRSYMVIHVDFFYSTGIQREREREKERERERAIFFTCTQPVDYIDWPVRVE